MRIFATSDIHGNKKIADKLRQMATDVDLILVCGDIGGKDIFGKTFAEFSEGQKKDASYLTYVLQSLPIPSRFILGNDDWFEGRGKHYLRKPELVSGASLVPFELVGITPFNTNREANENKLEYELRKLSADKNSIIVAHMPPLGAGDVLYTGRRCGSRSVRAWIEEVQPKLWLCGHIHEDNSSAAFIGDTLALNCACNYPDNMLCGWIVDTDTLDFDHVRI